MLGSIGKLSGLSPIFGYMSYILVIQTFTNSTPWQEAYIGLSPLPVTVTTRIITFLVGNPYKPSFATVTGRGDNPRHIHRPPSTNITPTSWHFLKMMFFPSPKVGLEGIYISRSTNITNCTIILFLTSHFRFLKRHWFSKQFTISWVTFFWFPPRILCFPTQRPCLFLFFDDDKHTNNDENTSFGFGWVSLVVSLLFVQPTTKDFSVNANQKQILSQMSGRAKPGEVPVEGVLGCPR